MESTITAMGPEVTGAACNGQRSCELRVMAFNTLSSEILTKSFVKSFALLLYSVIIG